MKVLAHIQPTYAIHGQIMPDAVLPSLGFRGAGLVRVVLEPIVDVAEYHGVPRGVQKSLVDQLGVRLLLVKHAALPSVQIEGTSRGIVMRCRDVGGVRVGTVVAIVVFDLERTAVWRVLIVVAELHQLGFGFVVRQVHGIVVLGRLNVVGVGRERVGHGQVVGQSGQIKSIVGARAV